MRLNLNYEVVVLSLRDEPTAVSKGAEGRLERVDLLSNLLPPLLSTA